MTQAINLANFANNLDTSGGMNPSALNAAVPISKGGTASTTAAGARAALSSAVLGANSDITSLTGLTTALSTAQGGTGSTATAYANLTTNVAGILPIANGGTGAGALTVNNVLLGNGTSAVQVVAPSTSGNVLTSNGTTWSSTAPVSGIGSGQIWVDVTTSRTATTVYTNSTSKPIQVNIWGINGAAVDLTVGGVVACRSGINSSVPSVNLTAIVPAGSTYSCGAISSLVLWTELR